MSTAGNRPNRQELGRRGENEAAAYLESGGYEIIAANYRTPLGEIDLVARHGHELVFVEVKTRRQGGWQAPEEAVDIRKQKRLRRLAQWYMQEHCPSEQDCRFDVLAITTAGDGTPLHWNHVINAF